MKEIVLHKGDICLVDDDDFERLNQFKWHSIKSRTEGRFYVVRKDNVIKRRIFVHREIISISPGKFVDHINGNSLDNRKCNLREATSQQNSFNQKRKTGASSRFKGVSWDKCRNKWTAQIMKSKVNRTLGRFTDEIQAAVAYDEAAVKMFGEFARLNFPNK